ncbi:MAG TPA: hypothetical protein VMH50_05945 [Thermoleophilia bacterium]|nr:hypothetical protein [Thermoleophilia bacterium]
MMLIIGILFGWLVAVGLICMFVAGAALGDAVTKVRPPRLPLRVGSHARISA